MKYSEYISNLLRYQDDLVIATEKDGSNSTATLRLVSLDDSKVDWKKESFSE